MSSAFSLKLLHHYFILFLWEHQRRCGPASLRLARGNRERRLLKRLLLFQSAGQTLHLPIYVVEVAIVQVLVQLIY